MWGGIISIGRCHRDIASRPGLRFSPLEIFAQRQFQPILPWIFRKRSGLALVFILLILHREPARMTGGKPMSENHALAPLPQRTLDSWHRFVASGDRDLLASLLSEHIVFRSPFVQAPIPGRTATLLVLTTVVQIFENFRYHRSFIAGPHDAALEFAANIGKWQLKGIDLIKFNEAGEMVEFEVMIRPIKALAALGEEMGNRIGPQLSQLKQAAAIER
jgi:hypothetical protein